MPDWLYQLLRALIALSAITTVAFTVAAGMAARGRSKKAARHVRGQRVLVASAAALLTAMMLIYSARAATFTYALEGVEPSDTGALATVALRNLVGKQLRCEIVFGADGATLGAPLRVPSFAPRSDLTLRHDLPPSDALPRIVGASCH